MTMSGSGSGGGGGVLPRRGAVIVFLAFAFAYFLSALVRAVTATLAPTLYLEVRLAPGARLELPALAEETAIYTVDAPLQVDGQTVAVQTLAVLEPGQPVQLASLDGGRYMVLGGASQGYRHIWWNFVASDNARIDDAAERWRRMEATTGMGQVQGETEFIPVPDRPARKPGT